MRMINKKERRNLRNGLLFILPNVLGFMIFIMIPVLVSFGLSFTDWDGFGDPNFVGFTNYVKMFSNTTFKISFWNTLYFTVVSVPVTLALSLVVANALKDGIKGIKIFRTAFFLPYLSATVAVAVVWQLLYHPSLGPINQVLMSIGIENPPKWLSSSDWAMTSIIIMTIWKSVGYYMVIFLAGLQGIPEYLYEASEIDGANKLQQFFKITIPSLSPTIFFTTIIAIINSFKVFDQVYMLTEGGPGRATNVLAYTVYIEAFTRHRMGYASAMAYILFIMIMIVTLVQFKGQKKWVNY